MRPTAPTACLLMFLAAATGCSLETEDEGAPAADSDLNSDTDTEAGLAWMDVVTPGGTLRVPYVEIDGYAIAGGDMILERPDQPPRSRGLGRRIATELWPRGVIPYRLSPGLKTQNLVDISWAMAQWQSKTDIVFVERTDEADYVDIVAEPDDGLCWSEVGRRGGRQEIKLRPLCGRIATAHELGHTIGLWHEHTRPDRDDYIVINEVCIESGKRPNYVAFGEGDSRALAYGDYDDASIMHYPTRCRDRAADGTCLGCPDLLRRDGTYLATNREVSAGDVAAVAEMYAPLLPVQIGIEAEAGGRVWPMRAGSDDNASGGRFVWVPNGGGAGGRAVYSFTAPRDGVYALWGRVRAPSPEDDSLYVRMDAGAQLTWHTPRASGGRWVWGRVTHAGVPASFGLSAGVHTLQIGQREDGTALDRLIVTDDLNWTPQEIWIEAETASLAAPMQAGLCANASAGRCVFTPNAGKNDVGAASFYLWVSQPGRYVVRGRARAPDDESNSFWVRIDNSFEREWQLPAGDWSWSAVDHARNRRPSVFQLRDGVHWPFVRAHKDGAFLDRLLITNDLGLAPRPAPLVGGVGGIAGGTQ